MGRSGAGKTYLLERLLPRLSSQGFQVAVIKHTHHQLDLDKEGTDTFRLRQAGVVNQALAGPGFCAAWTAEEPNLDDLIHCFGKNCHIVLLEGYKSSRFPKVEVVDNRGPVLKEGEAELTVTSEHSRKVESLILSRLAHLQETLP